MEAPSGTRAKVHVTRAFLEGMRDAALQEIHEIDVIDRHIEYCTGCFACKRNGGTCIHDDDMRAILDEIYLTVTEKACR